jgi:hypothetical protein
MMTTETTWGEGVRMMIKINRLSLVNIYFVDDNFNDQMMRREKNEKKKETRSRSELSTSQRIWR